MITVNIYTSKGKTMSRRTRRRYGVGRLLLDFLLVIFTGGLWLLWIVIRFFRTNS